MTNLIKGTMLLQALLKKRLMIKDKWTFIKPEIKK